MKFGIPLRLSMDGIDTRQPARFILQLSFCIGASASSQAIQNQVPLLPIQRIQTYFPYFILSFRVPGCFSLFAVSLIIWRRQYSRGCNITEGNTVYKEKLVKRVFLQELPKPLEASITSMIRYFAVNDNSKVNTDGFWSDLEI